MSFPQLSSEPLEQWLIEEAVMARYDEEVEKAQEEAQRKAEAQAIVQEELERFRKSGR